MDQMNHSDPACPFCPFSDPDISRVVEHVDVYHPEVDTQAEHSRRPANAPSTGTGECPGDYAECPHGCGEIVLNTELAAHLDLHFAETVAFEDISSHQPELPVDVESPVSSHDAERRKRLEEHTPGLLPSEDRTPSPWSLVGGTKTPHRETAKRLGRTELGPHAHEKQMPSWLRRMLERGSMSIFTNTIASDGTLRRREAVENETRDVIPVLARLCEQDKSVQRAFFCSPKVHQISKIPKEGGFCGYRNIQMLITFLKETQLPGHERFPTELPTIFQLQDMIEDAWDKGFNSVGRVETGGIRGTRKYIGTPEAQALFSSLGIQCEANSIGASKEVRAHDALYMNVAAYFRESCALEEGKKVMQTNLPPIYFQHQGLKTSFFVICDLSNWWTDITGHSMTIIGFEIRDGGSADILVFDPMFRTPPAVKRLRGAQALTSDPARVLKAYRRGTAYLQKYKAFELLKLKYSANSSSK